MSSNTADGDRVELAFTGGLDTTVCVPLLDEEYGYNEVIGITVDVGQPDEKFAEAKKTAAALDLNHYVVDAKSEFAGTWGSTDCGIRIAISTDPYKHRAPTAVGSALSGMAISTPMQSATS